MLMVNNHSITTENERIKNPCDVFVYFFVEIIRTTSIALVPLKYSSCLLLP
jgi:hypothetical protein